MRLNFHPHFFAVLAFLLLQPTVAIAAQNVKVGASPFAPYIEASRADVNAGVKVELIDLMNAFQDKYHFELVETGPVRRFIDFDRGLYDVSCFDNLAWGWGERAVEATAVYLTGAEVYVALAKPGRDQTYFADLTDKRMIGMRGYHYGFAKFNADPRFLQENFQMALSTTNDNTLQFLLLDRGDVAVVTDAFLPDYFKRYPQNREKLLISKRRDQNYAHSCIVRSGTHPSAAEMDQLLQQMDRKGVLQPLWRKYGVDQK
jgi:ABC-type amino acid transport substrate-binding protein